jgi:hypothetical protein
MPQQKPQLCRQPQLQNISLCLCQAGHICGNEWEIKTACRIAVAKSLEKLPLGIMNTKCEDNERFEVLTEVSLQILESFGML